MRRPLVQTLVSWLCLIAFGLGSTVFLRGMVLCSDSRGTRLEWGCTKTQQGECLNSLREKAIPASGTDDRQPEPCNETPVKGILSAVITSLARAADTIAVAAPVAVATQLDWVPDSAVVPPRLARSVCLRPPDSLGRLRTVILLV